MSDIVERLRVPVMYHSNAEQTNAERREAAAAVEQLRAALQGDDPGMPPVIQPLSWLRSAIDALKNPEQAAAERAEDPDAFATMILELEALHERARAAIAKAGGKE